MRATITSLATIALTVAPLAAQNIEEFTFDATSIGGQRLTSEQFENNIVIVDLWGTWCGPCVAATPVLQELYEKYKHHGLEIIGFAYEGSQVKDPATVVRNFATERGLTYHLAVGTPAIQRQVPGRTAYPTLLFFNKGMAHDHTQVGFNPLHKKKMENWVREAVGLERTEEDEFVEEEEETVEAAAPAQPEEPEIPPGVIYMPGQSDRGVAFDVVDVDGEDLQFETLKGHPVVIALTSTWDHEAAATWDILSALHDEFAEKGAVIIGAYLEQPAQRAAKIRAIRKFQERRPMKYRAFPAGLDFQRKIHLFRGMPLFLVFDKDGVLVQREAGMADDMHERLATKLEAHL